MVIGDRAELAQEEKSVDVSQSCELLRHLLRYARQTRLRYGLWKSTGLRKEAVEYSRLRCHQA